MFYVNEKQYTFEKLMVHKDIVGNETCIRIECLRLNIYQEFTYDK